MNTLVNPLLLIQHQALRYWFKLTSLMCLNRRGLAPLAVLMLALVVAPDVFAQSSGIDPWGQMGGGLVEMLCSFFQSPIILVAAIISLGILGCAFFFGQQQGMIGKVLGVLVVVVGIYASVHILAMFPWIGSIIRIYILGCPAFQA